VSGPRAHGVAANDKHITRFPPGDVSPHRRAIEARRARPPTDIAQLVAGKYPASPIMSYIPALSWIGGLKVSQLTGDPQYRDRVRAQAAPFLSGEKPSIVEPYLLTSLAGHQALADLGTLDGNAEAAALARKAADFILSDKPGEAVRFATSWTDDMFMATSVLARAAATTGEARYADAVSRLLTTYAQRLQRRDGVFIHAERGPHAWGRGNGFAAFGLIEALTHLPADWPAREAVLDVYRRQMTALRSWQAPDGAWREVIDEPGSYRELTATAMITTAMARGIRLGWLPRGDYQQAVDAGWRAVAARVTESGDLVDVCTGTGAGQNATFEYYVNRPAIVGPDDRGGAMALTAALEVQALRSGK
jgi:rhamnogalacturonyl hydrolase YesR